MAVVRDRDLRIDDRRDPAKKIGRHAVGHLPGKPRGTGTIRARSKSTALQISIPQRSLFHVKHRNAPALAQCMMVNSDAMTVRHCMFGRSDLA
jgi:hypothetical protein